MNAITFFTGIGMFDFGLHAAGFEIIAQVEYEPFCQDVLRARWPFFASKPPQIFGDIREIDADDLPQDAELFIGGFPCQPFSTAGFQQGQSDDRNMWPEFARIIGDYQPRWVVLENVPGITISQNGQPAYALKIISDLARFGYDSLWATIPASDCGMPHQRKRWWCIAEFSELDEELDDTSEYRLQRPDTNSAIFATPNQSSRAKQVDHRNAHRQRLGEQIARYITESRLDRNADGVTAWMDRPAIVAGRGETQYAYEPPRLIPGHPENWSKRIAAIGNGGIPHIAYAIGRAILEIEGK